MRPDTTIVEEAGVRYRFRPAAACYRCDDSGRPIHSIKACHRYMVLPRVPDWPLPGPAPQYLSDDPACPLAEGDWYVNETRYGWAILQNGGPMFKTHKTLGEGAKNSSVGERAWLIARADPTEDA